MGGEGRGERGGGRWGRGRGKRLEGSFSVRFLGDGSYQIL